MTYIKSYIKSPHTKIQLQTSTTSRKKHYGATKKERFLHGRFWSRARQRDVRTDRISFERLKNYFERLKQNKNFEWLAVNGYGKISNGASFLTESEQNRKGALYVNNQPQVLVQVVQVLVQVFGHAILAKIIKRHRNIFFEGKRWGKDSG